MDELWECLLNYVEDYRMPEHLQTAAYSQARARASSARAALEKMLSPEQREALEAFQAADAAIISLDEMAIFREAVALGRWMAR